MEGEEPGFAPVPKTLQLKPPQPEPLWLLGGCQANPFPAPAGGELMGRGSHHDGDQPQETPGPPQ